MGLASLAVALLNRLSVMIPTMPGSQLRSVHFEGLQAGDGGAMWMSADLRTNVRTLGIAAAGT